METFIKSDFESGRCFECDEKIDEGRAFVVVTNRPIYMDVRWGVIVSCEEHDAEASALNRKHLSLADEDLSIVQYTECRRQKLREAWFSANELFCVMSYRPLH